MWMITERLAFAGASATIFYIIHMTDNVYTSRNSFWPHWYNYMRRKSFVCT